MSRVFTVTGKPAEGKLERLTQLISAWCDEVHQTEPGTVQYQFFVATGVEGTPKVTMIELYESDEAMALHGHSEGLAKLFKTFADEALWAAPPEQFSGTVAAGFRR